MVNNFQDAWVIYGASGRPLTISVGDEERAWAKAAQTLNLTLGGCSLEELEQHLNRCTCLKIQIPILTDEMKQKLSPRQK